jgi:hypothetical protein
MVYDPSLWHAEHVVGLGEEASNLVTVYKCVPYHYIPGILVCTMIYIPVRIVSVPDDDTGDRT